MTLGLLAITSAALGGNTAETTESYVASPRGQDLSNIDPNLPRKPWELYPGITLTPIGYAQTDWMTFGNPILKDSGNWRAGRTLFVLSFVKKFDFIFAYNWATDDWNQIQISVNKYDLTIDFGQIYPVFALSNSIASPYFSFLEIPLVAYTMKPGYRVGTQWTYHKAPINFSLGVYRPRVDHPRPGDNTSAVANFIYVPYNETGHVMLVNSAAMFQAVSANPALNPVSFSAPPLTLPYDQTTLISASVPNSRHYWISASELATTQGSFTGIIDYTHTWVKRVAGFPYANFYGYFVLLNYFITGETRLFNLNSGSYLAISKIRHKYGAIEISLIYDYMNLMSGGIAGGRETDYGISFNWYPAPHANFRLQYIHAVAHPGDLGTHQTANIAALRMEFMW